MSFFFSKCETNLNPYSSKIHKPLRYKVEKKRTRFIASKAKQRIGRDRFFQPGNAAFSIACIGVFN